MLRQRYSPPDSRSLFSHRHTSNLAAELFFGSALPLSEIRFAGANIPCSSPLMPFLAPAINSAPCCLMRCIVPEAFTPTERTRVIRESERAYYERETIYKILDEAYICHVGFAVDGQPYVIPTIFARLGDALFFHGSAASRMLRNLSEGIPVCVTVTLTDGFVLARSVFYHSMNYRSVVALGKATNVEAPGEKLAALHAFTEKIVPGRWDDVREPSAQEFKATNILRLPLTEVSAKIRTGPPMDEEADYARPVWAGVIPLQVALGKPIRDERCDPSIPFPGYLENFRR